MKELIQRIVNGEDLELSRARSAMDRIISGKATASQIAGFLVALASKGETVDELTGFATAFRQRALRVDLGDSDAVDNCGTGGDGKNSFNISTTAAIIAAAAGVKIAKQGTGAISSRCGSAELLQSLKIKIDGGPRTVRESVERIGIGFILVPLYHPSFKYFTRPVSEIGIKTVIDTLIPLINPAGVKRFAIGLSSNKDPEKVANVLTRFDVDRALVYSSDDGLDELSLSSVNRIVELNGINMKKYEITAADVGLKAAPLEAIKGGLPEDNAVILADILGGREGAPLDIAAFNAGAVIYAGGKARSIAEGVQIALNTIKSGKAGAKFEEWKQISTDTAKSDKKY